MQAARSKSFSRRAAPTRIPCNTQYLSRKTSWFRAGLQPSSCIAVKALTKCVKGDLLQISSADGQVSYGEVVRALDVQTQAVLVVLKGRLLSLTTGSDEYQVTDMGAFPHPEDSLFRSFPGWKDMYSQWMEQSPRSLPELTGSSIKGVDVLHSLRQLQSEVTSNPAFWCDGTGPSDPALTPAQHALLNAGELLALEAGHRGVCLVQLHVGWGGPNAVQPVLNPFVIPLLHRLSGNKDIQILMSPAPGGLGLTAILCARKEPFRSWARHMLGFGAQAAVVADSPYYKLLIGRMMGYKAENIICHIKDKHGLQHPTPEVVAAVDADMRKLSSKPAVLPWTTVPSGQVSGQRRK